MRKLFFIMVAGLLFAVIPSTVQAHVLKTDGDIGAVLHILPDDAPVINTPTPYEFAFQRSAGSFSLRQCVCNISFILDGTTVISQQLQPKDTATSRNTVTFTKAGVYTFRVTGKPRERASFTSFTLDYPVRVGTDQADVQPIPPLLWLGIGMGTALVLLYANTQEYKGKGK